MGNGFGFTANMWLCYPGVLLAGSFVWGVVYWVFITPYLKSAPVSSDSPHSP